MSDAMMKNSAPSVPDVADVRLVALHQWVCTLFPDNTFSIVPVAGDASFRRYFRLRMDVHSFILMDAPPALENCEPFVAIANAFEKSDVRFPSIISRDLQQGFLLLTDFGDQQLLPLLHHNTADGLYRTAIDTLFRMQQPREIQQYSLPCFDANQYWREFGIFYDWYLAKHMNIALSQEDEMRLKSIYQLLIDSANAQPQVFVHRDYHARNIMVCDDNVLGILDFQDALWGPITYDLVSLLRDCYIAWPDAQVETWVHYYYALLQENNALMSVDFAQFMRWFDWVGLQRHLKCLGIFSRLSYRDQKHGYLKEIPRVLRYVVSACDRYEELAPLSELLRR